MNIFISSVQQEFKEERAALGERLKLTDPVTDPVDRLAENGRKASERLVKER